MLKAIHHRVKNNLQVISSLLSLQESHVKDEKISQLLRESGNRLHAMALIHESLYQSADLKNVDLADFLPQLIEHVFESYEVVQAKIALSIEVEPRIFEADTVVNFGLIVNELVSNAFKHAFPGERRGRLQVIAQRQKQELVLTVSDDGVGIAAHVDIRKSRSMGMQVVHGLVRQLRGALTSRRDGGTTIEMHFPLPKLSS